MPENEKFGSGGIKGLNQVLNEPKIKNIHFSFVSKNNNSRNMRPLKHGQIIEIIDIKLMQMINLKYQKSIVRIGWQWTLLAKQICL